METDPLTQAIIGAAIQVHNELGPGLLESTYETCLAYELASLYPEVGRSALTLPLFAAAMMELAGPALCRLALRRSGECENEAGERGGIA